jgi:hypothetical protein
MGLSIDEELKQMKFGREVLGSLLVSSMEGDKIIFPSIKEFILSEVVNGTISYIGGNSGKVVYREDGMFESGFEEKLWKYFLEELKGNTKRINQKIRDSLERLCSPHQDRHSFDTELYSISKEILFGGRSSASLPYSVVKQVQEKTLPSFSKTQRRDIEGIGKAMRPEIEEDLVYIHKKYSW